MQTVTFDPDTHTYRNAMGTVLMSATQAIRKYIQPNYYSGVPQDVLAAAAKRGSAIHEAIDEIEKVGRGSQLEFKEIAAYCKWCEENKRGVVETEQMVSDGIYLAGTIDQIEHREDGGVNIADIKTTSVVNEEYLQWQLSIYANLYEITHPGVEVKELYCIHLHGEEAKRVDIQKLPEKAISYLRNAIAEGIAPEEFINPMKTSNPTIDELVAEYRLIATESVDIDAKSANFHARMDEILAELKTIADREQKTEINADGAKLTRSKDVTRNQFSKEIFFEKHPDLIEAYEDSKKPSVTPGKIKIKLL